MPIEVVADLRLEVDGIEATVVGSGDRVVVYSADPAGIVAALGAAALPAGVGVVDGPRALGRVADALADAGLRVEVTGPRGSLLTLGAGSPSPIGGLVTGSRQVRPGSVRALRPLVVPAVRRRLTRHRRLAWALVVLGAGLAARRARTTDS